MRINERVQTAPLVWTKFFPLSVLRIQWHTIKNQKTEHTSSSFNSIPFRDWHQYEQHQHTWPTFSIDIGFLDLIALEELVKSNISNKDDCLCKWIGPYVAFLLSEGIDGRGTELYRAITLRIAETYINTVNILLERS